MRSTPPSPRRWDGSFVHVRARRSLRVDGDSASRLLRCGQSDRCRDCGNRVEWYHRTGERPIRLHPQELPAEKVPATCHWHVSCGVAHPAGDGSGWCRLPHAMLCPAHDALPVVPELAGLRRALAVNSRRLIDSGAFVPRSALSNTQAPPTTTCRPPVLSCSFCTSATSPTDRWTRSSASPRLDAATAARVHCSHLRPGRACGLSCPPSQRTANFPCPARQWPSTRSPVCLMPSNCGGGLNAAPSMPSLPRPPM